MKKKISKQMAAFIVAAMLAVSGLSGCGAVKETEIPTETAVLEETTEEVKTEEVEESTEQEETSEAQDEGEGSEAQNEDENEAEKIDWAAVWPKISQASSISPVEHLKDADICIEGYWETLELDEESNTYADYSYQNVILNDEGRKTFPKLAEAIDKYNTGAGSSKDSFFSDCSEKYKNNSSGYDSEYSDTKKIYLARVDDQAFSFIESHYYYDGKLNYIYSASCVNLDTDTGEEIKLSDVIADEDKLIETIFEKLDEQDPILRTNGDDVDDTVVKYIKGENKDDLCWVMMPFGITLFFNPGVIREGAVVPQEVTVTYLDNPELFTDKYTADTGNWAVPLREAYIDVNGDGKSDHIYAESSSDEESFELTKTGIYVNENLYTFDYIYDDNNIFVKNGSDYYMYVVTTQESDSTVTYIYKLSGSEVTYIGELDGAISDNATAYNSEPYKAVNSWREGCLYNPEHFYVHHVLFIIQVSSGIKASKVGTDGLNIMLDEYYAVSGKEITSKTEFTAKEVDEEGNVGEEKSFPAGVIFKIFRSDYETFADCVLEDGSLFRLELEKSDTDSFWPDMTNGKDLDEVFEAESLW